MRNMFIFILLLMLLAHAYVAWRVWRLLPAPAWGKWLAVLAIVLMLVCLITAVMGVWDSKPMWLGTMTYNIGGTWTVIFLYLLLVFIVLDIGQYVRLVPWLWVHNNLITTGILTVVITGLLVYGNIHYNNKVRETLALTTAKKVTPAGRELKMVLISDLHIGYHNRRAELARWVDLINDEHPDLILIAGDIIDGRIRPVLDDGDAEELRRLEAPVIACLGNHEYITGLDKSLAFYRDAGITLLRDSTLTIDGLTIIGRDDFSNPKRKPLEELMAGIAKTQYTIVLDHQPQKPSEAERCRVDFMFSGHTHHGQVWPISLLTEGMYVCAYGPYQSGDTRYYVSSGLGIWGGKYRIGTQSEYVVATLTQSPD